MMTTCAAHTAGITRVDELCDMRLDSEVSLCRQVNPCSPLHHLWCNLGFDCGEEVWAGLDFEGIWGM